MIVLSEILPLRFYEYFDGLQFQPFKNRQSDANTPQEWLIDETIKLQFEVERDRDDIYLFKDGVDVVHSTDVTPTGWTGSYIKQIEYTPTEVGEFVFSIKFVYDGSTLLKVLTADCLHVKQTLDNHVKVIWSNSENKDGIVYNLDAGQNYFTTFVRGIMFNLSNGGEFDTMKDSDGQLIMLKSEQRKKYDFKAWMLDNYLSIQMALVGGCDIVSIDGDSVIFEKPIEIAPLDQKALYTLEGEAFENDWNQNEEYEIEDVSLATDLFMTVKLSSIEYSYTFRTNKNVKYSVNGSSFIYDTSTTLRNVVIQAAPSSEIQIYTSLSALAGQNLGGEHVTLHDIGTITNLTGLFAGNTNLKSITIEADLSNVTSFNTLVKSCIRLESITGLTEDSFASVTDTYQMVAKCYELKEIYVNITSSVTSASQTFYGCKELTEIRGVIDTTGSTPTSFMTNCDNLIYPLKGTYTDSFVGGQKWINPKDCDITIETKGSGFNIKATPVTTGLQIYVDNMDYLSAAGYSIVAPAGTNTLMGINIPTGCTALKFGNDYDNINNITIGNLGSITIIDNFLEDFENLWDIIINNTLSNILYANSAFKNCNKLPNYFNVPALIEGSNCFENSQGDIMSMVTTNTITHCDEMFKKALITNILGHIDTTGASVKTDMFQDNIGMIKPTSTEKTELMSSPGYIYEY